jgi:2-haloacid dehalogenase
MEAIPCRTLAFDAYGTLFDVRSVEAQAAALVPDPAAFVAFWRTKQLEYSWLRTLLDRYADFEVVSRDALHFALERFGLALADAAVADLMEAWLRPHPFPDAEPALRSLAGWPLAILSNGSPRMLERVLDHAGFGRYFQHVISVDPVRRYKPAPAVYAFARERLGVAASDVLFVSSNGFDVAGAKAFGFRVAWINRANAPLDRLGCEPDAWLRSLEELSGLLMAEDRPS